ncbi:hypothetical protein M7I_0857 [Glarea lozoyensis 74030]|uniref:Uncharacterized protein n=1 Tax=Glarea lozoyensis (strain ATCC 74030 / MF5533) TaxID=1104152 RepID=H0EEI0_GLAL7|nr:hypothetical protein M7I_0857 [Glarea lozoyensis 74030]
MERLFLKEHVRQMDWAKLNNGLKFLIYRTIFINQPNNEAVFELLQLEEGDLNHFYDIFNNEERIHLAFEAAHEAYRVAMRGGPKKMSSSSRQKNGSMLHSQEAYEDRLTELHTEIDNLNRSRKVGFRKAVVALEDEIRELESEQLELDSVASPSRTSSPEVETDKDYGYKDPKKLTAAHLRNLDKLPRPTEYCLSVRDVQDGFRDVEEGEREHEPVYYLAALPVMQSIEQAQHAIELRPSPGSAEQAIAQQVRRQVVLADDKRVHTPSKLPQPDFKRPGRIPDVILMVSAPKRSNPNSAEDDAVKV